MLLWCVLSKPAWLSTYLTGYLFSCIFFDTAPTDGHHDIDYFPSSMSFHGQSYTDDTIVCIGHWWFSTVNLMQCVRHWWFSIVNHSQSYTGDQILCVFRSLTTLAKTAVILDTGGSFFFFFFFFFFCSRTLTLMPKCYHLFGPSQANLCLRAFRHDKF